MMLQDIPEPCNFSMILPCRNTLCLLHTRYNEKAAAAFRPIFNGDFRSGRDTKKTGRSRFKISVPKRNYSATGS